MSNGAEGKSIAISRQQGSGGAYVGRAVAERLGYRYFDREMFRTAAEYLSGQAESPEQEPRGMSWFERLGTFVALSPLDAGYIPPSPAALYEGELTEIENRLIQEIVDGHGAVIVGRGAAQILRGRPGVVTVFLHAPEPWRVDRVREIYKIADQAQALKMVRQSDQERARFVRRISEGELTDARGYDLAINSMTLGLDRAVDLIVRSAGST